MKYWKQLGQTLIGERGLGLGIGLAMNGAGDIIVCGQSDNINEYGPIKIFKFNQEINKWEQLGNLISIEITDDNNFLGNGWYVDLSDDGYTFITTTNNSYFQVYSYNEETNTWEQKGESIYSEIESEGVIYYNSGVSINNNGTRIAVGNSHLGENEGNLFFSSPGMARVFEYKEYTQNDEDANKYHYSSYQNNDEQPKPLIITKNISTAPEVGQFYWTQLGSDLDGIESTEVKDNFAYRLTLSKDGTTLAVGAKYGKGELDNDNNFKGYVKIYTYNTTNDIWEPKGSTIYGLYSGDGAGTGVALNESGNILAISHPRINWEDDKKGYVRIFEYNNTSGDWEQLGQTINEGALYYNNYGWNIDLSSDGYTIVIGAFLSGNYFGNSSVDLGRTHEPTQIFEFDNNILKWKQKGQDLIGNLYYTGHNVKINSNGNKVIIGSFNKNNTKVYEYVNDPYFGFKVKGVLAVIPKSSFKIERNIIEYILIMWKFLFNLN